MRLFNKDEVQNWLHKLKPESMTCFKEKMKVYAPLGYGKCRDDIKQLVDEINAIFGGATVYDAEGSWYDKDRKATETEPIKVIEVGHDCLKGHQAKDFVKAITKYATACDQKSISLHDGRFYIAETPEMVKRAKEAFGI